MLCMRRITRHALNEQARIVVITVVHMPFYTALKAGSPVLSNGEIDPAFEAADTRIILVMRLKR